MRRHRSSSRKSLKRLPKKSKTPLLVDLVDQPLVNGKICCPFHDDSTPSCHIYPDHFHCFGCGAHGDAIDWLMMVEGLDRDAAIELLANWQAPSSHPRKNEDNTHTFANAMRLWEQAQPIAGTPAIQYLADVRRIDTGALPAGIETALRFHPRCPFGPGTRHPCLLALMRDGVADAPTGIQRIALTPEVLAGGEVERRMLGRAGVVKLWPAASSLVIGEGLETVLAAATRIPYRGAPLQPAWSTLTSGELSTFPVLPGVERLIILVDHDINGAGQLAATVCTERWSRAGRTVVRLTPERAGADFNDLVMPELSADELQRGNLGAVRGRARRDDRRLSRVYARARYIFMPCREFWPATSVNSRLPPMPVLDKHGKPKRNKNGKLVTISASKWLDQNRAVEQMTWCPGCRC